MADVPTPRSFQQILSDEINVFLSKTGLKSLRVGNPLLSIFEASAQNDVKSTQDVFNALNSQDINRLTGDALKKLAADENVTIIAATASSNTVNFFDTSFTKISTIVYPGASAPNPGTLALIVSNVTGFPATGSVYIGRNTLNYEGPIAYTSVTPSGSFGTINLSSATTKFHNTGETVILAQGGNRLIPTSTTVQTPQGNATSAVQFSTLYNATLLDGETEVDNVLVVCQTPGTIGNVAANSISQVLNKPFIGAAVNNPLPFTNGLDTENDESIRESIIAARASRSKGTDIAILSGVQGVSSPDDNKTVVSSSLVNNPGQTSVLYIDDGTGYQETTKGIAQEILMDFAVGGEQFFELSSPRPIAKAFVTTGNIEPYNLSSGSVLSVTVGGIRSEHTFNSSDFISISNGTAFEVVSSINSDPNLLWSARVSGNGNTVSLFGKNDVNEDLQVGSPSNVNSINANSSLLFPTNHVYTLRLFKNDQLLYKDGQSAILTSNPQSSWSNSITSGDTLTIAVDGTPNQTITVTNQDFVNNNTGYASVSASNSLLSWVTVLNSKVSGATFSVNANELEVVSNLGANGRAALNIISGTLTTKNMFTAGLISNGLNNDYSLNRNLGQIQLNVPLSTGDQLVVGTSFTRAYAQSKLLSSSITFGSNANLWVSLDSNAKIIQTGVIATTSLTLTSIATNRARYTGANGLFTNLNVGDWVILWDPSFTDLGQWVISDLDTVNAAWFEVERTTVNPQTASPSNSGIVFVRTGENPIQNLTITAGSYSLSALVNSINGLLLGGFASLFRNSFLRIVTDTYGSNGNVMIITADLAGQQMLLPLGILEVNNPSHFATIESNRSEVGTPKFHWTTVSSVASLSQFNITNSPSSIILRSGDSLTFKKRLDVSTNRRWGADAYSHTPLSSIVISGTNYTLNTRTNSFSELSLVNDRVYAALPFALGWDDTLNVVLDQNATSKNFSIPMFRNIGPLAGQTYSNSLFTVLDLDNASNSLSNAFGTSNATLFNDFALYMKARGKSHSTTVNKTILWRYGRYGSEGNVATVAYVNPTAPSQSLSISTSDSDANADVLIGLPSNAAIGGTGINANNYFVDTCNKSYTAITTAVTRAANVVTVDLGTSGITQNGHTLNVGDNVYQITDDTGGGHVFRAGPKNITAITATTFSYNETGANDTSNIPITYSTSPLPAGTTYTVTNLVGSGVAVTATIGAHLFVVGQTVYFEPGHFDPTSNVTVAAGSKVLTAIGGTTVTWSETTTAATANLIAGVNYTLSSGQCQRVTVVYYKQEVAPANLSRASNVVTANLPSGPIIGTEPFNVGDVVYLSPGEANFPSGPKIVTSAGVFTFTYSETGANASSVSTEFFSTTNSDPNFSAVIAVGNIVNIGPGTSLDSQIIGSFRVNAVTSTRFSFLANLPAYSGNIAPKKINNVNNLQFYTINPPSASSIVSFIGSNGGNLISATLVPNNGGGANTGAATVSIATNEEFFLTTPNASLNGSGNISVAQWPLFDGLNFIASSSLTGGLSRISLKDPVSGELTANNDFNNETMKLVPTTAINSVNYISNSGVSALGPNGSANTSTDSVKVQIGTQTIGSQGAVQVTGGTANSTNVGLVGYGSTIATPAANYGKVTIPASQVTGLTADQMVQLQGTVSGRKVTGISNTSTLAISNGAGDFLLTFDGGTTVVRVNQVITAVTTYQIERHGDYMAFIDNSAAPTTLSSLIQPGDWVYIVSSAINPINSGYHQLIAIDIPTNTFWIKLNGVEQVATTNGAGDYIKFISYDSALPGDKFIISTNILGVQNMGVFTVTRISESGSSTDNNKFYVSGNLATIGATALNANYVFFTLTEASPLLLVKHIRTIVQTPGNSNFYDVLFTDNVYIERFGQPLGATITALDKYNFPTSLVVGLDGYSYNTGLLSEVNKVAYGDESNPSVYPGIIASGANIDISGPLIKGIEVSIAIRLRTGAVEEDVISAVQNVIATTINQWPIGKPVAIAAIVTAAYSIDGVTAVSMISPVYNSANDIIPVQPNQKPLILNIDQDISVSIVGE